jgi:hypothetical protein
MKGVMELENQKITAHIPKHLLAEARKVTGLGITETLKSGLEKIVATKAYSKLAKLRGTYKFTIDLR